MKKILTNNGVSGFGFGGHTDHQIQSDCFTQDQISSVVDRIRYILGESELSHDKLNEPLEKLFEMIHSQFLLDVCSVCDEENFKILETSIEKSVDNYEETLARLVPNHQEILESSRRKIITDEIYHLLIQKVQE